LSLKDFLDIYAVRMGLEGMAAHIGAPALTDENIVSMEKYMAQLDGLLVRRVNDLSQYLALEWSMHELCYLASGHARLIHEIRLYRVLAERYLRLALAGEVQMWEDLALQRSFYEACNSRQGSAAEAMARTLLEWTVERIEDLV
jgi:DNA-binding GntR family transcriptional regulator